MLRHFDVSLGNIEKMVINKTEFNQIYLVNVNNEQFNIARNSLKYYQQPNEDEAK